MRVQIEEKEFESQFLSEFERTQGSLSYGFSIGQAMEGFRGFEGIFYTNRHGIFHRIGLGRRKKGRVLVEIEGFEDVRANLFIQFKRSAYCRGKNSKPFRHWRNDYYEFKIDKKQQKLLSDFSRTNSKSLAVIYAAPVFHLREDLKNLKKSNSIIKNSNVVKVSKLNRHSRYTFTSAKNGKAFSEPENIIADKIENIVAELLNENSIEVSFFENVSKLADTITKVCAENKLSEYLEVMSSDRFTLLKLDSDSTIPDNFFNSLSKVLVFQEMTNTRWIVF